MRYEMKLGNDKDISVGKDHHYFRAASYGYQDHARVDQMRCILQIDHGAQKQVDNVKKCVGALLDHVLNETVKGF